jgi:hypothetical protein
MNINNNIVNVCRKTDGNQWLVRVQRKNVLRAKTFSDSKFKSTGRALDAALAHGKYLESISWPRFIAPVITNYRKSKTQSSNSSYNHFMVPTNVLTSYINA